MKKQLLLLTAGGMLAFASCKNEAPQVAGGPSQEQIDSMVNARVEEMRVQLMAETDSMINALAQWKADSMIAAMKGAKVPAKPKAAARPTNKAKAPTQAAPSQTTTSPTATPSATGKVTPDQGQATGKRTGDQGQATGKKGN